MKRILTLALVGSMFLSSCCSIVNGRHDEIEIRSSVPGSSVFVDGVEKAKTPCTVDVKRTDTHSIEIKKDGYHPYQAETSTSGSWWLLGNVVAGGLIGVFVDICTGAWADVTPDEIDATLTPIPSAT